MLLKFSSSDILHSDLVDRDSGKVMYTIKTTTFLTTRRFYEDIIGSKRTVVRRRMTIVRDRHDTKIAQIVWAGRIPTGIKIYHEKMNNLALLFQGCDRFNSIDRALHFPTRLNCQWVATKHSLRLNCLDSGRTKSAFHLNSMHLLKYFMPAPLPLFANNFLEISSSSSRARAEMIGAPLSRAFEAWYALTRGVVTFLIIEVIRRNVFDLRPEDFNDHLGPLVATDDDLVDAEVEVSSTRSGRRPSLLSKLRSSIIGRRILTL
ncbi:hypothetical protein FA95DRAFT_1591703 [Auriscalpium vulgare]|uniref:Uncharacterized protein n=1 Tax=Auriscalpium vulgare TaxID=40419 RepID=A0ACB8SD58_9AGAM|nr:hypothetical protein FA95DRAFT_1591703 [Auriscalpium vulgare]